MPPYPASEVLTLLKAGYAPAAHARWRALHELTTTAYFIAEHGKDVAERYLLHEHVEAWKAAQLYQKHSRRLRQRRYSRKEMAGFRRGYEAVLKKYGKEFKDPYGWAAAALGHPCRAFSDIEEAVRLDHLRPYYKMASYPVHATVKSIRFSLALSGRQDILLTGPSNYGLVDPGHSAAISLSQITTTLLMRQPSADTILVAKTLGLFVDEIGQAFLEGNRRLNAKIRSARPRRLLLLRPRGRSSPRASRPVTRAAPRPLLRDWSTRAARAPGCPGGPLARIRSLAR